MLDTELTVSHVLTRRVDLRGLDFNGVVRAISEALAQAGGELLGKACRAVERLAALRSMRPGAPNRDHSTYCLKGVRAVPKSPAYVVAKLSRSLQSTTLGFYRDFVCSHRLSPVCIIEERLTRRHIYG